MNNTITELTEKTWKWHGHSQMEDAFRTLSGGNWNCVKSNPVRTVYRIEVSDECYYLKHDHPSGLLNKFKERFRNKVQSEYLSAQLLENAEISVVNYLGWGKSGSEGLLLSEELPNCKNAKQYWFNDCVDANQRSRFIKELTVLLGKMLENHIFHPDMHLGNLLLDDKRNITIVDPYGIRTGNGDALIRTLIRPVLDMRGELTENELSEIFSGSGLTSHCDATAMWKSELNAEQARVETDWLKRKDGILRGKNKFCKATECSDGLRILQRQTLFYQPYYTESEIDKGSYRDILKAREVTKEQATEIWLDSFHKMMLREKQEEFPLIWEQYPDGKNKLYFTSSLNKID